MLGLGVCWVIALGLVGLLAACCLAGLGLPGWAKRVKGPMGFAIRMGLRPIKNTKDKNKIRVKKTKE